MRTYDFSPLWRSTIGFDRLFDLAEMAAQRAGEDNYPPYNIERLAEDRYQISLAVAGFSPGEISITAEQNVVTIEGSKSEKTEREFLYRGISTRQLQAAVQPGRLRAGEERRVRQRPAQDRTGPGDPRSHEAAPHRDQRRTPDNVQQDRSQGGLSDGSASAAAPDTSRGCRTLVCEWRIPCGRRPRRRQRFRLQRAAASRHGLRSSQGCRGHPCPDIGREAGDPRILGF